MPYIKAERRELISSNLVTPQDVGELNFKITKICLDYIDGWENLNYQKINDIIGALDCAKQEFYRRIAVPYENSKIATNGDVY